MPMNYKCFIHYIPSGFEHLTIIFHYHSSVIIIDRVNELFFFLVRFLFNAKNAPFTRVFMSGRLFSSTKFLFNKFFTQRVFYAVNFLFS